MQTVTVRLPDNIYMRLKRTAKAARQPVNRIVTRTLAEGLPQLETPLSEHEQELNALESLSDEELWEVMLQEMPAARCRRWEHLLEKRREGALSPKEQGELNALKREGEFTMLAKGRAAVILKWRGHRIPSPAELEQLQKQRRRHAKAKDARS